jgi:hypothetical protein
MPATISFLQEHRILPLLTLCNNLMGYVKTSVVFIITKLLLFVILFWLKGEKERWSWSIFYNDVSLLENIKKKKTFLFLLLISLGKDIAGSTNLVIFEGQSCLRFGPMA